MPARPAHISFSVFDIECPSDEAAADMLTRISQHAVAVRERLGQQSRHARKIGQRGDGLVLTREARHHHQPQPSSTVGFQRTTVGVMVALLSAFAMSRL